MKKLTSIIISFLFVGTVFAQSNAHAEKYLLTFFKKLNDTQQKLTFLNKTNSFDKIGTETVNGDISGTLFYDVQIKGMGAEVTIRYTNFCDEPGWIYDGEIITHSNLAQNGSFEGTIKISGKEPGSVSYDDVKMKKGMPSSGNYLVKIADFPPEKVDYSMYQKSKE